MTDEELLTAYLDGQLEAADLTAFEARLASEPELARRLERLSENDATIRAAFDRPMQEPVPDSLLALLGDASGQTKATPLPVASNDNRPAPWRWGGAIAASLAIGLLLGSRLPMLETQPPLAVSSALDDALTTTASGQKVALRGGAALTPSMSFAGIAGGYCRQFELSSERDARAGIACRNDSRGWRVIALLPSAPTVAGHDVYVTAEGAGDPALDAVAGKLRSGDPLSASDEAAAIQRGWRPE